MLNSYKTHLYYGNGKGKTTAATGLSLRAAGSGMKVVYCQFLKNGMSGELKILSATDNIEILYVKENFGFTWTMTPRQKQRAKVAYTGLFLSAVKAAKEAEMLVLDEIVDAVTSGLVDNGVFTNNINMLKGIVEIVMTGHNPPQSFLDFADYVTEMRKVRHPFDDDLPARKGIEY